MKRKIKFRAWDKKEKVMSQWHHLGSSFLVKYQGDRYVYMQYTGLKDKNGKEIYESDIVKICHWNGDKTNREWVIGEIYWDEKSLQFSYRPPTPLKDLYGDSQYYEVIGNIYEQPNLLTN